MADRTKGAIAMGVGAVLAALSIVGLLSGGDDDEAERATAQESGAAQSEPTPTPQPESTATPEPAPTPTATPVPTPTPEPDPTATPEPEPTATPEPDVEALATAWVTAQSAAFEEADVDTLFARLHPLTIDRYGGGQCQAYLTGILPSPAVTFREYLGVGPWDYGTDDIIVTIEDAISVEISRDIDGQTFIQEVHYALVDGEVRWFTDCGDPVS